MTPNRHVSYSRATEDELRTSSCFRAKARLYNAGHFLPSSLIIMRDKRTPKDVCGEATYQEDKQAWENCGMSCRKTIEILNTERRVGLKLTYRLEKSLFQKSKRKVSSLSPKQTTSLMRNWPKWRLVSAVPEAILMLFSVRIIKTSLRWLNTVLRAVSGNSRDGACFKLDKQTWRRKKQWYTDDDFSKSTH